VKSCQKQCLKTTTLFSKKKHIFPTFSSTFLSHCFEMKNYHWTHAMFLLMILFQCFGTAFPLLFIHILCPGVGTRVRSYIPGSATDQTLFRAKCDHGLSRLCYGLGRYITGVAPEALRCIPIRLDPAPGIGDRAPISLRGVTEVGRQCSGVKR